MSCLRATWTRAERVEVVAWGYGQHFLTPFAAEERCGGQGARGCKCARSGGARWRLCDVQELQEAHGTQAALKPPQTSLLPGAGCAAMLVVKSCNEAYGATFSI